MQHKFSSPEDYCSDHDGKMTEIEIEKNSVELLQQQKMTAWHTLTDNS
jgi:hypothetical protein